MLANGALLMRAHRLLRAPAGAVALTAGATQSSETVNRIFGAAMRAGNKYVDAFSPWICARMAEEQFAMVDTS